MEPRPGRTKHSYSVREAAAILGCSESHVRKQIRLGAMPGRRFGERYSIPVAHFEVWRRGHEASPPRLTRPWG